jgi:hypothetical protein
MERGAKGHSNFFRPSPMARLKPVPYPPPMVVRRFSGFIAPCLPSKVDRPPTGPLWVHEIKHDGYRLMVRRDGSRIRCFTRNGHDWADRFTSTAASIVGSSPTACAPQRASFARSAEDIRKSLAFRPKLLPPISHISLSSRRCFNQSPKMSITRLTTG